MTDQSKYTQKLKDARVLIIGGSAGIGYGVAEAVLESGGIVTISSSNPERVRKSVESLLSSYPSAKGKVTGHACDLAKEETLDSNLVSLFETSSSEGKLDHVVFTAGDQLAILPIADASLAQMKQAGMVRFFAPLMVGKIAPKYMASGPGASITLTTGAVSERPMDGWAIVGSFATGLHGMMRGLALDLKPIRVNLVSPGAVMTPLWDNMSAEQRAGFVKSVETKAPTGKIGQVVDVAESYLYLMKDRNITGSMISTNSGSLLV